MKSRYWALSLILTVGIISYAAKAQTRSDDKWRDKKPKTVTLFAQTKYKTKSAFSFKHDVRNDTGQLKTHNRYDLSYGNINFNGDSDWFSLSMSRDDYSRIKDLGELNWSDVSSVPYLPAGELPPRGIRFPSTIETFGAEPKKTETFEESSNGKVTKVVAGHIYVLHTVDSESDFYTLLRVEKIVPGEEVTISWKAVPAPRAN